MAFVKIIYLGRQIPQSVDRRDVCLTREKRSFIFMLRVDQATLNLIVSMPSTDGVLVYTEDMAIGVVVEEV